MSDYTLLTTALQLGGKYRAMLAPGEGDGRGSWQAAAVPAGDGDILSTAHISPFIEWGDGSSFLKVCRGGDKEQVGGGKRQAIKGFSYASRRRLMVTISKIRRDALLPAFVTLTYPEVFPNPAEAKKHLDTFNKRMRRAFPGAGWIWKLEPQQRGAPHFHLLVWGASFAGLREFVPGAWYEIAGGGDYKHLQWHKGELSNGNKHCVQRVNSFRGVWAYAAKYLGKTFKKDGWDFPGRVWAVVNRQCIPFGVSKMVEVVRAVAVQVMRYQRRYARMKKCKGRSMTTFCDADQWINRLEVIPVNNSS